ncbi:MULTISPECIES: hypothetical protein [Vibrio]|jgi:hypothetical protein|uniref:hypothetical protein n=1 Tax=Vibrio TaxID=662 RepID=UPI000C86709F|nr:MULTISPECIES: hypothetical protein [Vibrio]CAK3270630.1 hypothetical protein VCRA2126E132_10399 [Vibrio crassostreae]MCT4347631.1 hypothetical protein [Vibrio sp. NC2]MDH5888909.1 hypothetical protein [Vibrio splendidus]NOJ08505.1 hypothetical protein [Vibrio splendidus]PMH08407.1 hypothetical protein BCU76_03425 [Vibrio lentus]
MNTSSALVITVQTKSGTRFFCGFGKRQHVKTAWHIAGSKFFTSEALSDDVREVCDILTSKGKTFSVHVVKGLLEEPLDLTTPLFVGK